METEGVRTDRLGLLLDQFDRAREMAQVRLTGLGDEEYLWERVPGCWSIRRRGEATTPRAFGPGEWVLDQGEPQIPANEYAEVARQAAGGMTVAKIADDWSVSVERVEQILGHTGPPEPDEAPVTTIAWRLGHLHFCFAGRWEWTFGERRQEPKLLVDFTPSAAVAVEQQRAITVKAAAPTRSRTGRSPRSSPTTGSRPPQLRKLKALRRVSEVARWTCCLGSCRGGVLRRP
jgi:hypothetical protein